MPHTTMPPPLHGASLATQEQCNVLYFYHDKTGSWIPVPLAWESQVPSIAKLTKDVQVAVPWWQQ